MTDKKDNEAELKACPLAQCGGDAQLIYGAMGGCYIECTNCGLTTRLIQDDSDDAMNHDLAVRLWNSRALRPSPAEKVELVERIAEAMAEVIAKRHGHSTDNWLNDQRREEARAAITAFTAKPEVPADVRGLRDTARQLRAFLAQDSVTSIHLHAADLLDSAAAAFEALGQSSEVAPSDAGEIEENRDGE